MNDQDGFDALITAIETIADCPFVGGVYYGPGPAAHAPLAGQYPRCELYPSAFVNADKFSGGIQRTVDFQAVLVVSSGAQGAPAGTLTTLAGLAALIETTIRTAADAGQLADCLPPLTWIRGGSYLPARYGLGASRQFTTGEVAVTLSGQFAYLN